MITNKMNRSIQKILFHYGEEAQTLKVMEELDELKEAVVENDRKHIIEEIADVYIMLEQLKKMQRITDNDVFEMVEFKINRTLTRIEEEKANNA